MRTFKKGDRVRRADSTSPVGIIVDTSSNFAHVYVKWPESRGWAQENKADLVQAGPAPFRKGDRVVHDSFPDDVLDVLADQFTSGAVYIKWPDGSSRTVYNKVLTRIDPLPVDKTESIGSGNNRSINPEPFKHDNGGWLKAGPTPIINDTGAPIQIIPLSAEDVVNHPTHYTSDKSGVECIQITRHRNFAIGSAIKYLWRAGLKQDPAQSDLAKEIEDLQKSIFYIKDEIARLSGEQ